MDEEKKVSVTPPATSVAKEEKAVKAAPAKKEAAVKKEAAPKKPAAKKAAAPKKPAAKKAAAPKKAAAKKPAATKAAAVKKSEVVRVEFNGKSYTQEDLLKSARDVWQFDIGKKAADLKSIELYVKPDEERAYYVFNNDINGSFSI